MQQPPTCLAPGRPGENLILAWHVVGATGAALSVDSPGVVGSLKKELPLSGTLGVKYGCSGAPGSSETHVFDLYAIGGSAPFPFLELKVSVAIPPSDSDAQY